MAAKRRWSSVLFWSVLSAAFIGPGTVTLCAKAGAEHRFSLVWALIFSIIACIVLQEAAARIAAASGMDLARAVRSRFTGPAGGVATLFVLASIVAGCAAYEAGNLLGALAGLRLIAPEASSYWLLPIALVAASLLAAAATGTVARLLGWVVAIMGFTFVVAAISFGFSSQELSSLARGALIPTIPAGSALIVLGMIGTTVVPYNLFLGSALSRGRDPLEIRFGLIVALLLGGLISIAVLTVGRGVEGAFSFEALAASLESGVGGWGRTLFAVGLAAAGLTSALTAPLAAAWTARGLYERDGGAAWGESSWRYRSVWIFVLLCGVGFGVSGIKPIPAIVAAQALNGIMLPAVAIFILLLVNDRARMGRYVNGWKGNIALGGCVLVCTALGAHALWRLVERWILS